jgi:hypothetical protein
VLVLEEEQGMDESFGGRNLLIVKQTLIYLLKNLLFVICLTNG